MTFKNILGGWQFTGIPVILDKISTSCLDLRGLSLTGWEGLSLDNVRFIITNCHKLERIDLSGINVRYFIIYKMCFLSN